MKNKRVKSKEYRIRYILSLNIILLLAAATLLTLESFGLLHTVCLENYLFGIYCPGCGTTRLCRALLAGDVYQAFRYNPFVFILTPVLAVIYILETVRYIRVGSLGKYLNIILIAVAVVFQIYGIIRNFPAFSFLAPVQL